MADAPESGFKNTRLLAVAVVLGVVFVVLLNWQRIGEQRRRERNRVEFVLVTTDLTPGQVLTSSNIEPIALPRSVAEKAKGLYEFKLVQLGETRAKRFVAKNDLLRLTDMQEELELESTLSKRLTGDRRVIPLTVDSRSPSAFIRSGSRVDVLGAIRISGQPTRTQLIIENLEVLSVDGQVDPEKKSRSYRTVEVHVPTDLAANLKEAQRRAVGPLTLLVRKPGDLEMRYPYDRNRPERGGAIAPEVLKSLSKPFVAPSRNAPGPNENWRR